MAGKKVGSSLKGFLKLLVLPKKLTLKQEVFFSLALAGLILLPTFLISLFFQLFPCYIFLLSGGLIVAPLFIKNDIAAHLGAFSLGFIFIGSFFLISEVKVKNGFKNIKEVSLLAEKLFEENIQMENKNPLKPKYENYYRDLHSGFFSKRAESLMQSIFVSSWPSWTEETFLHFLEKVNKQREEKRALGDFVNKIFLKTTSKIVVFGDIQGAFTSLARDLEKLVEIGILDESLTLKSIDDYIVFNGDAISRSPFQLETLSLIFKILLQNPENAFYMKGNHESNNYWHGFGLKDEMQIRLKEFSGNQIPFGEELNTLFNSLPMANYFKVPGEAENSFVRIGHFGASRNPLMLKESENKFFKFLTQNNPSLRVLQASFEQVKNESGLENVFLQAIIKSEKKRDTYQDMDGLRLLPPEGGVPAWTMISCPTEVYRKGLNFFFDTFAVVQASDSIQTWKITLYKQDIRTQSGFEKKEYNLLTGQDPQAISNQAKVPNLQTKALAQPAQGLQNKVRQVAPQPQTTQAQTLSPAADAPLVQTRALPPIQSQTQMAVQQARPQPQRPQVQSQREIGFVKKTQRPQA